MPLLNFSKLSGQSSGAPASGGRDIHFIHSYIVYQLLSRRLQRDLLLVSALLASQPTAKPIGSSKTKAKTEPVDSRLYPAVLKLLDTVLQSLNQMRTLSIVDDGPDLASAVEARITFIKARRHVFLCLNLPTSH